MAPKSDDSMSPLRIARVRDVATGSCNAYRLSCTLAPEVPTGAFEERWVEPTLRVGMVLLCSSLQQRDHGEYDSQSNVGFLEPRVRWT